jgi:TRAP-type C4-dicarboxylate transport system permease small subunit
MQGTIILALVLGAACYLVWYGWRAVARTVRARRSGACGPGCGCDTPQ